MAMDLTIRDWMVIIGVLLIVAVGIDAWRRVRNEKRSPVKVKLVDPDETGESDEDDALFWPRELPNGPARVVQRRDLERAAALSALQQVQEEDPGAARPPGQESSAQAAAEPDRGPAGDELVTGLSTRDEGREPENLDWLEGMDATDSQAAERPAEPGRLPRAVDPEVFMLNVVSRSREGFRGEDILHILLACDLRFGDMNFFHRHEYEAGRGAIQFSVANMMQPGVFDIDNMSEFSTPGLVFFLTLPGPDDMMQAFDCMLETARAVARNLDGDVLDESRSVLTRQTLEHCRQEIRDLERRMLARAG